MGAVKIGRLWAVGCSVHWCKSQTPGRESRKGALTCAVAVGFGVRGLMWLCKDHVLEFDRAMGERGRV